MSEKYLGKIESASFGRCGYQDEMLGLKITFLYDYVVSTSIILDWLTPAVYTAVETSQDGIKHISKILITAKANNIQELIGKPVEVEIEDSKLKSWRILTEVL